VTTSYSARAERGLTNVTSTGFGDALPVPMNEPRKNCWTIAEDAGDPGLRMPRSLVYLVYATSAGHALIDRDLYLPRAWTDDTARCQTAGELAFYLLIPLTCNEVQHLFAALVARPVEDLGHRPRWSVWPRRHQQRARTCHYRRQAAWQP
jgi:hypothetical protein